MSIIRLVSSIEIECDDLIDTIHNSIDHDDVSDFIKELDLRYQDFEVTEKTICSLLDSMRKEFAVYYDEPSEEIEKWDQHVSAIKKMMESYG